MDSELGKRYITRGLTSQSEFKYLRRPGVIEASRICAAVSLGSDSDKAGVLPS